MEGKLSDTQLCKSLRAPEGQIKGCPPSLLRRYLPNFAFLPRFDKELSLHTSIIVRIAVVALFYITL
jgi:hypothetical protein